MTYATTAQSPRWTRREAGEIKRAVAEAFRRLREREKLVAGKPGRRR